MQPRGARAVGSVGEMTAGARVAFTTDWVAKMQLMATERTDPDPRYKKQIKQTFNTFL